MQNIKIEDIEYLLSSCNDIYIKRSWDTAHAGSYYSNSMGLKHSTIDYNKNYHGVFIIDTMIQEIEFPYLDKIVRKFDNSSFIFKIIDPYYEYEKDKYFFKFLFSIARLPNVYFLTNLYPAECTYELSAFTKFKKMLFLPYPYQVEKERILEFETFSSRKHMISYSGAINNLIYPKRSLFLEKIKWNPILNSKLAFLKHPKYLDHDKIQSHQIIGDFYIDFLEKYQIMYLDPSRIQAEFVKYSESAYAGCVPFGEAPINFSENLRKHFLTVDYKSISKSFKQTMSLHVRDLFSIAEGYRTCFKEDRNVLKLQNELISFINNNIL